MTRSRPCQWVLLELTLPRPKQHTKETWGENMSLSKQNDVEIQHAQASRQNLVLGTRLEAAPSQGIDSDDSQDRLVRQQVNTASGGPGQETKCTGGEKR
jgi:hypothetical protein